MVMMEEFLVYWGAWVVLAIGLCVCTVRALREFGKPGVNFNAGSR